MVMSTFYYFTIYVFSLFLKADDDAFAVYDSCLSLTFH